MNLDLLWEHEKRRGLVDESAEPTPTGSKAAKRASKLVISARSFALPDDKIFEKSGFALDYEGHTSKRMSIPAAQVAPAPEATPKRRAVALLGDIGSPGKRKPTTPHKDAKLALTALTTKPQLTTVRKERANRTGPEVTDAFRHYIGDHFGTRGEYIEGMLYMSRMKKSHAMLFGHKSSFLLSPGNAPIAQSIDGNALKEALADAPSIPSVESESSNAARVKTQAQRCSSTLANWSSNPANARLMVDEGVVQAIILLSKTDDLATRIHCVTTFMNLSNVSDLRRGLIKLGAVKTIVSILNGGDDKTLQTACALTLCNLCCLEGDESTLVADGAVGALAGLINETASVASICERGIFNLTCVKEPYYQIEVVIKALVALSASGHAKKRTMHMCATSFVNLSNMKRVRSRLMEEGIVSAITALLRSQDAEVKHMLAYVLCNISAMRSCRVELVTKGSMNVLVALAGSPTLTPQTQWIIGSTLSNFSKESTIRLRLVLEGLLSIVTFLLRSPTYEAAPQAMADDIRKVCATAVHNCSCSEETRSKLVERDGIAILTALTANAPHDVKRMGTLALCNFLMVKQAAIEIAASGALSSLFELAQLPHSPPPAQLLYAAALYNLCQNATSRESMSTGGGIAAIVHLCHASSHPTLLTLCTAALCYLAADAHTRHLVANLEVVRVITRALATDVMPIQRYCVACLSMLSQDEACAGLILHEGGVGAVLESCVNSRDSETKACCCDLLASLSFHEICRVQLVHLGVLPSLTKLAKLRDPEIQRRCATTLGNLASEKAVHDVLLSSNIVSVLSILSNSYSEESQSDCAKALCNLSCSPGYEAKLVSEGAVGVLFMICAVRSGSAFTKETCARALGNLLLDSTMAPILKEGLVKLLPAITKLDPSDASPIPATIYAKLLRSEDARSTLCHETQSLRTLVMYMQLDHPLDATTALLASIACELALHANTRMAAVREGLIDAIVYLSEKTSHRMGRLVSALLLLALHDDTREYVSDAKCITVLLAYLEAPDPVTIELAVSVLCHVLWHDSTRQNVDVLHVSQALIAIVPQYASNQAILDVMLLGLCCLSFDESHAAVMIQHGIFDALLTCHDDDHTINRALMCILVRQLSRTKDFAQHVLSSPMIIELVSKLACSLEHKGDEAAALDCADVLCSMSYIESLPRRMVVKDVIRSLQVLLTNATLETKWRCAACLCMLSAEVSVRQAMVQLGCTRLLVQVAMSKAQYDIYHCCAMALGHLSNDMANTHQMVVEQAVPALLHLAKIDNDVTRDACSLALANLSRESPKVASGAVLALINLSMVGKEARGTNPTPPIVRPPTITHEHQKTRTRPPQYKYPLDDYTELCSAKFVAEIPDRQPPIPHLPVIAVDMVHLGSDASGNVDVEEMPQGNWMQFSKVEPMDATCHVDLVEVDDDVVDDTSGHPEVEPAPSTKVDLDKVDEEPDMVVSPAPLLRKRSQREKRPPARLGKELTTKSLVTCASEGTFSVAAIASIKEKPAQIKKRHMSLKTLVPLKAVESTIPVDGLKEQARKLGLWS
ncbi:hypothetical protein SPRG_02898 [Saprolegnia parasitica CBS 223.65]|uniref:Armadillo repeat-containing domain-containing protein n=1 Tax=Saprolegnia parasitica (strain CBS 223.65) TaxID=695850 RepID=A0A067D0X2_SAPPC|nr:hypothetical protein SPRG_02898 [Saprolegnia parasitica CBS 223.65]KDO32421.1 hypothetical protein SPRG_02898 [Saprolegnia parasitica CBS 223.65]|eukprot:XP_012196875.1 hypothetical protein SPRG_02898 [Saprolegnia parasitica CBS 223.65]